MDKPNPEDLIETLKARIDVLDTERKKLARKHRILLERRTPQDWDDKIKKTCPDMKSRAQVARLVAFDYGTSDNAELWAKAFDKYMALNKIVYGGAITKALETIGYSKQKAILRGYEGKSRPAVETQVEGEGMRNELLDDLPWIEAKTKRKISVRSSLPNVAWRPVPGQVETEEVLVEGEGE